MRAALETASSPYKIQIRRRDPLAVGGKREKKKVARIFENQ